MVPASWLEAAHPTRACTLRNKGIMISGGAEGMTLPSAIMQIISIKGRAQNRVKSWCDNAGVSERQMILKDKVLKWPLC